MWSRQEQMYSSHNGRKVSKWFRFCTVPRKIVPGSLSFEPYEFGIFWNLHQTKGVPTPHFLSTFRLLGVPTPYFSSTYRILGGCPPLTFHQPKGFQGVLTPYCSSKWGVGTTLKSSRLMKSKGWAPLKTCWLMKFEGWAPLKTYRLIKSEGWAPL